MTSEVASLISGLVRDVPDFPEPGIVFKDIAPLLADRTCLELVVNELTSLAGGAQIVAGVEARGFLLAGAVAVAAGCGLVPVRKAGKLPPPTVRKAYQLEYGRAEIEVPVQVLAGKRVFLVDDVLATGGTLAAAVDLIEAAGGSVAGIGVLLEIGVLGGAARLAHLAPLSALLRV
ncbi:MAG: adenine phosphoribosyltransferase [Jatrophihabitans sp.]|nr:MAG: adenine phosphoribosyltransferase [Jatrophihabitans sp.]